RPARHCCCKFTPALAGVAFRNPETLSDIGRRRLMSDRITPPWALILAGGDGTRLRPLTTQIAGDDRPKQFCALLDGETLLERTRRRADLVARFDHQAIVVTRAHEPYFHDLVPDVPAGRLVIQPDNRGTGPGIVYSL